MPSFYRNENYTSAVQCRSVRTQYYEAGRRARCGRKRSWVTPDNPSLYRRCLPRNEELSPSAAHHVRCAIVCAFRRWGAQPWHRRRSSTIIVIISHIIIYYYYSPPPSLLLVVFIIVHLLDDALLLLLLLLCNNIIIYYIIIIVFQQHKNWPIAVRLSLK